MKNYFYTLSNGIKIPCLGFGTYKAADNGTSKIIRTAIKSGYRCFDTASFYGTETFLSNAIKESNIPRESFFITSKVWKEEMGFNGTKKAFERSLERLKTDYIDLYLIHWPLPQYNYKDWKLLDIDTWKAMEDLYNDGRIRAIGLSNFLPHHIENIIKNCKIKPMVNQLEFHPGYSQEAAVRYCKDNNILVQAWSPLGRTRVLQDNLIIRLAAKYNVSPAQICLRYAMQKGVMPLSKASTLERMKENQDIFGFEIETDDIYRLETMPQTGWSGEHPDRERVKSG